MHLRHSVVARCAPRMQQCTHIHTYVDVYMQQCTHIHTYIDMYMNANARVVSAKSCSKHAAVYTCTYAYICIDEYIYKHMYICIHTYIICIDEYIYKHVYICIHMYR